MIRPSDAGAPRSPHGKGVRRRQRALPLVSGCRICGIGTLVRSGIGWSVGFMDDSMAGLAFAERVGAGPGLGFVQVEGRFLVSVGLPGGEVAASRGLGLGFGCRFAFIGGGLRMLLHGCGGFDDGCGVSVLGAFGLAYGAGLVSCGLVVRVRGFRGQALVLEEADSGGGVVHAVDRRAHHGFDDPVVVVARPLAGEPRVHEEQVPIS